MTDINTTLVYQNNLVPVLCDLHQGTDYARLVPVASSVPCSDNISAPRILRLPEVKSRVGLCRASIYNHMAQGSFPKPISLGLRAVGWLEPAPVFIVLVLCADPS
jgi:prophage regulatory protein